VNKYRQPTQADRETFTQECLDLAPGQALSDMDLQVAWVAWCSDWHVRPTSTGLGKAVVAYGGQRRLKPLRYEGVALKPWRTSGYRSRSGSEVRQGVPETDPTPALVALAPIVAGRDLDQAYLRLTGSRAGGLCRVCGQVTRHAGVRKHVGC